MMTVGERFHHLLCMFVVLLVLYISPAASAFNSSRVVRCIEKEREALLLFKQGLVDDYGSLSSWGSTEDCCKWSGIKCSNWTSHVIMLDLFYARLRGTIPNCLSNFTAMSQEGNLSDISYESYTYSYSYTGYGGLLYYDSREYEDNALVLWKGLKREYTRNLGLLKIIDLSANKLVGEIPREIANLIELVALNLSRNNLSGQITPKIGQLKMLDSLDFSQNQLLGEIPASLSNLDFLGVLNLSNNNLSGKIPVSPHLQTFDASSYMGNPDLCGPPLPNKCPGDETALDPPFTGGNEDPNTQEKEDDGLITPGFFVSMALGFIIGFWGVCSSLFLINSWRHAYFHFLNKIRDRLYVIIAVNVAKLLGRLQA